MGGRTEVIDAIRAGDLDAVHRLMPVVELSPSDWDEPDEHPMLIAFAHGTVDIAAAILDHEGSDAAVNRRYLSRNESHSLTPLAVALLHGNVAVAECLIERNADVNASFLTESGCPETVDIARFFGDESFGRSEGICWWLADKRLQELMRGRALKPNATTRDGTSALILAIEHGNDCRVRRMLELGADPDRTVSAALVDRKGGQIPEGSSALIYAVFAYWERLRWARRPGNANTEAEAAHFAIAAALLRAGASLSPSFSHYVDGMEAATVCDWVLEYGDEPLLELFGLSTTKRHLSSREDA